MRVDRPAAVGAHGGLDKLHALARDGVVREPATGEAHGDKTGERRGLEKAAVARLDLLKHLQRLFARRIAEQTGNRVPRGPVMMSALADGDERRQRVTHHRQTQGGKPGAR